MLLLCRSKSALDFSSMAQPDASTATMAISALRIGVISEPPKLVPRVAGARMIAD
jgi:hypothetical protein